MIDRDALRRAIVAQIWTPDLRAELVDRVVELCEGGGAILSEFNDTARRALYSYRLYQETNHARGLSAPWMSIAAWAKRKYEADRRPWTPVAPALEPKPTQEATQEPTQAFVAPESPAQEPTKDDAPVFVVYRNQDGRDCSIITNVLTQKQADALTDELAAGGKTYTHREMRRIISDYNIGIMPPVEHDPYLRKRRRFAELVERYNLDTPAPFDFDAAARAA